MKKKRVKLTCNHVGLDVARKDDVGADVSASALFCEGSGEACVGGMGGSVRSFFSCEEMREKGGNISLSEEGSFSPTTPALEAA